jgi:VanZ family protein
LRFFLRNNGPGILWGALIVALTAIPGSVFPELPKFVDLFQPDKLVHLFIFLVFVFLLIRGFRMEGSPVIVRSHALTLALTLAVTIGGATEIMQGLIIPMRVASPWDFLANVAGSILGAVLFVLWERRDRKAEGRRQKAESNRQKAGK